MALRFGYVPPPFGALWPAIFDLLDKAVRKGGNDWSEVAESLADGRSQLWLGLDRKPIVAAVSRIDGDTFEVWLAGGKVLSALPCLETAIEASLSAGTTNGRIIGRKGWERVLRPFGWRREGSELVKEWANEK